MASRATLHSRLRVLVAKTFRAEQLYASMRRNPRRKPEQLAETANDRKAEIWQRCHRELRNELNDALSLPTPTAVAARLQSIRNNFRTSAEQTSIIVKQKTEQLLDSAERHEFSHTLKLSSELVAYKASAQANKVIADELTEILHLSGKQNVPPEEESKAAENGETDALVVSKEKQLPPSRPTLPPNVIPLKKRFSSHR